MRPLTFERLADDHAVTLHAFGSNRDVSKTLRAVLRIEGDGAWSVMFLVRKWAIGAKGHEGVTTEHAGLAEAVREYNR